MLTRSLLAPTLLFLLLLGSASPALSQNQQLIDSLEQSLPTLEGKERIKAFNDLCWEYRSLDTEKALAYGGQGLALAQELKDSVGIAQSYNDMGAILQTTSRYTEALAFFDKSLAIRGALNDSVGIAALHSKIGNIHESRSDFDKAMEYWLKALPVFESIGHTGGVSFLLNNIAVINQHQQNYEVALEYYRKSADLKIAMEDWGELAGTIINIASTYRGMGKDSLAKASYLECLEIARREKATLYLSQGLNNFGSLLLELKDYTEAKKYLDEALILRFQLSDLKGEASTRINLGHCFLELGELAKAEEQLLTALEIANEIGAKQEIQNANLRLSILYEQMPGKLQLALNHLKQYANTRDSILNTEKNKQISELATRYETAHKERQLQTFKLEKAEQELVVAQTQAALTRSRWLIGALVGGVLLLLIIGALIYRQQQLRQAQLRTQSKIDRQQLQLQAILQGEERERKRLATDLHDGLGQLLSTIKLNVSGFQHELKVENGTPEVALNTSLGLIDEAVGELRNISHNLMPSALLQLGLVPALDELVTKINRSGQIEVRFQTFGMEERLSDSLEITLYRVVQELLNNALKYAKASTISVQLLREGGELNVMLEDNGVGFDTKVIKTSTGIGWQNMYSRVEMLGGAIEVDSHPGHGTTVIIDLPATDSKAA